MVNNDFIISTDKTKIDVEIVHNYLSKESYWAKNIPLNIVTTAIENSFCFGVYKKEGNNVLKQTLPIGRQVGFARVITDKATFAYLADVFIISAYRGKGLSKWLLHEIMNSTFFQRSFFMLLETGHRCHPKVETDISLLFQSKE